MDRLSLRPDDGATWNIWRFQPSPQVKMLAVNVSAEHRYVHICTWLRLRSSWHFEKNVSYHVCIAHHNYDLTITMKGGRMVGSITGEKAAKPVTTGQSCVLTFSKCDSTGCLVCFLRKVRCPQQCLLWYQFLRYFKPKHDLFLTLAKWIWGPDLTII